MAERWRRDSPLLAMAGGGTSSSSRETAAPATLPLLRSRCAEYRTAIGERAAVKLADGSTLTLNTDSFLPACRRGMARTRQVELVRGEAYFQVAKDAAHPFVVAGGGNHVTALGTAFSVRVAERQFAVALTEGTVEGGHARRPLRHPPSGGRLEADARDVRCEAGRRRTGGGLAAWPHQLRCGSARDVVAEMNRYSGRKLVLRDAALGAVPFSGVLDTNGGDALASALESYRIARVAQRDARELVLVRY